MAVVWQSTLVAGVVAAVAWLLRHSSPAVRYWLWQIVAIKILLAPAWTLAVPVGWLPQRDAPQPAAATAPAADPTGVPRDLVEPERADPATIAPETDVARLAIAGTPRIPTAALRPALSWQAWLMLGWAAVVGIQLVVLAGQRARLARLLRQADAKRPHPGSLGR